jgi:hypothetical protein
MPRESVAKDSAPFVFKGTIQAMKSATMKAVTVDERTAVVTVDQVLEAPRSLAAFAGHRITVQLSGRKKVLAGQQFIFHTQGWIFGDSVAVRSIKQEPIQRNKTHTALLSRGGDPVAHKRDRESEQRFDAADIVVSGKVTAIRLPSETSGKGKRASAAKPVSEHSPHWREAVVEIDDVHKGKHLKKNVVIRFPASTDVRWYKAPKFQPGQQGFFLLHKTEGSKEVAPNAVKGKNAKAKDAKPAITESFTALHPLDFQPYSDHGGVRKVIEKRKA